MAAWEDPFDVDEDEGPVIAHPPVKDDAELDITPMIDITFLLLIFFLVAARSDPVTVDLPPARYGALAGVYSSVVVTIVDSGGSGDALVYMDDGAGDDSRLLKGDRDTQEQQLSEWVQQELLRGNKTGILVKAGRRVRHADVARVSSICVSAGGGEGANRIPLHMAVLEAD